jgi:nicotinate-nucleotide adenylyltransferase
MRIALFGGAFDPVHMGHLKLADAARKAFKLDRVIFLPTGKPPHKHPPIASARDRLSMLRLAVAGKPAIKISDWELRRKQVTYSYQTIAHFRARSPKAELFFIVGTDSLRELAKWKKGMGLLKRCTFIAAERPDSPWSKIPLAIRQGSQKIPWRPMEAASREIRVRIKRGQSIQGQVPKNVERYIQKHGLYR